MNALRGSVMVVALLVVMQSLYAVPPAKISYQGVLTDGSGTVVPNGNYNLTFALYTAESGGTALWTETQAATVTNGIFNVVLGSATPFSNLAFDAPYYLGITVSDGAELTPRTLLTSAAYSLNAPVMAFGGSGATTELGDDWTNYEGDTVSIECPGPGFVVLQSSVWIEINHDTTQYDQIELAYGRTPTEDPDDYRYVSSDAILQGRPGGWHDFSLPVQTVFPVNTAGTYTYYLNGQKTSGTSLAQFWYANTVATWYPASFGLPDLQRPVQPRKARPVQR